MEWSLANMPDLTGRTYVVTGADEGLGLDVARALAATRARVVLGCADAERAESAAASILEENPEAVLAHLSIGLADLDSVRNAAASLLSAYGRIDALVNCGEVGETSTGWTVQGFALPIGVNYLAHFALTGLLLPRLERVVNVTSVAHPLPALDLAALHPGNVPFDPLASYVQGKLASLMISLELQQRFAALQSICAHPGWATTGGPVGRGPVAGYFMKFTSPILARGIGAGALPILRAAVDPTVKSGSFLGPQFITAGPPVTHKPAKQARDKKAGQALWDASVAATRVFPQL